MAPTRPTVRYRMATAVGAVEVAASPSGKLRHGPKRMDVTSLLRRAYGGPSRWHRHDMFSGFGCRGPLIRNGRPRARRFGGDTVGAARSETSPSDAALDDASDSRFRRFFSFFLFFFSFFRACVKIPVS